MPDDKRWDADGEARWPRFELGLRVTLFRPYQRLSQKAKQTLQRWTNRVRKPQSSEDRKARLDKLKQRLPCVWCGQLGHSEDDNECPAKVKVVNWEETEEKVTQEPIHFGSQLFCHMGGSGAQQQVV